MGDEVDDIVVGPQALDHVGADEELEYDHPNRPHGPLLVVIAGELVLTETMVAVWHQASRLAEYSQVRVGDLEEIGNNQLATLAVDEDAIGGDVVKGGLGLSELQQHGQQALDQHVAVLLDKPRVIHGLVEGESWLLDLELEEVIGLLEALEVGKVACLHGLGKQCQSYSVGYPVRHCIALDTLGVLLEPCHSGKAVV